MNLFYSFIIRNVLAGLVIILGVGSAANVAYSASLVLTRPPSQPPKFTPPRFLSPVEQQLEQKRLKEQALKNRQRLGLPSVDANNIRVVKSEPERKHQPTRDYSKQSCYHMTDSKDPSDFTFCDAGKCTFDNGGYCENQSGNCYDAAGTLTINPQGLPETTYDKYIFIKWDMCLQADGAPVVPSGQKSFDEKIRTGCAYRVGKTPPDHQGYRGYTMTCDKYRCLFHPAGSSNFYNRETKMYADNVYGEVKTPPLEYFPYLNWTCLDAKKSNRVAKKYRCSIVVEDDENWGCEVCFENSKHVYQGCKYKYNERGEIVGKRVIISDELQEQLDELERFRQKSMENPKAAIIDPIVQLEILFRQTPVSDIAQEKVVKLFEDFFERQSGEFWPEARLGQELKKLRSRINSVVKK